MTTGMPIRRASRAAWRVLGLASAGAAIIGVVVPGMPATVFVLIAFYCFSRSSPRLARWLINQPRLGRPLRAYILHGGLTPSARRAALAAMWTSIAISAALLAAVQPGMALGTVGLGIAGTVAIARAVPVAGSAVRFGGGQS